MVTHRVFRVLYGLALLALCAVLLAAQGWFCAPWHNRSATLPDGSMLALRGARLTITAGEELRFESLPGWRVEDALVGDIDHDGADDLALLVWRRGSFGPHLPFWHTKRDYRYSQHIFLYHLDGGVPQPFWMSSALRPQVRRWALDENDDFAILTREGEETLWGWRSWGIERLDSPLRVL